MSNVATMYSVQVNRSYERDGFNEMVNNLLSSAGRFEVNSDGLVVTRVLLSAKADVVTNSAVRMYALNVNMPATATTTTWVSLFNTSSASVTAGTTVPDSGFLVTSQVSLPVLFPSGQYFSSGMSWLAGTTAAGAASANASNSPTMTLVYKVG
jgi:hypothetical protein